MIDDCQKYGDWNEKRMVVVFRNDSERVYNIIDMETKKTILVVPDVHGRSFWRKAKGFDGEIVFLGDYLDPYPHEGITMETAIVVFREIIEWAKVNPRVHLLLGNHDWHYIYPSFNATRKDWFYEDVVRDIFSQNSALFHRYWFADGTLFTHAGLGKGWMRWIGQTNWRVALDGADEKEMFACGPERHGRQPASSPLWLDFRELDPLRPYFLHRDRLWLDDEVRFQIFGHTQLEETGDIASEQGWASIDSRAVFEVDPTNPAETLALAD